jgi:hypothetical protein
MSNTDSIAQNLDELEQQWINELWGPLESPTAPADPAPAEPQSRIQLRNTEDPATAICGIDFFAGQTPLKAIGFTNEDDRDQVYYQLKADFNDPLWPEGSTRLTCWERKVTKMHLPTHYDPDRWDRLVDNRRRRSPITGRYLGGDRPRSNGGI